MPLPLKGTPYDGDTRRALVIEVAQDLGALAMPTGHAHDSHTPAGQAAAAGTPPVEIEGRREGGVAHSCTKQCNYNVRNRWYSSSITFCSKSTNAFL